jgi:hypothetical protein
MTTQDDDQFQMWLMDMSDAIDRFRQSLPESVRTQMDMSPESLNVLEALVLERYPNVETIKKQSEAQAVDGMARYVGQTFRKHFGGKWMIELNDQKNVFYGLPQLAGMAGQQTQMCPLTLVTASTDRRTGKFIRTVFDGYVQRAGQKS